MPGSLIDATDTLPAVEPAPTRAGRAFRRQAPLVAVIWIDWYSYHLARFRALSEALAGTIRPVGIELVGGAGVHAGQQFRDAGRGGLPIHTLFPAESWHGAGQWRIAIATWRKLGELRPAAVLVPGYYTLPAIAAAIWGRLHVRPTILMTESTEEDHARNRVKEMAKSLLIGALFSSAIAGGEPHVRYLERLGFPVRRIARFYDVVDNDFFRAEAARLRQSSSAAKCGLPAPFFLYVGRLSSEKNIDGLLRAFAGYRHAGGRWRLVLAGDGPQRSALEHLARDLGVAPHVHWTGFRPTAELGPVYAFASCFVLPSTREPWGLVVNEALAAGLPAIVSSRCGCVHDLIEDGGNGFLFDPASEMDLEHKLMAMERLGPEERDRMRQRGETIIDRYSPRAWALEVERIVLQPGHGRTTN